MNEGDPQQPILENIFDEKRSARSIYEADDTEISKIAGSHEPSSPNSLVIKYINGRTYKLDERDALHPSNFNTPSTGLAKCASTGVKSAIILIDYSTLGNTRWNALSTNPHAFVKVICQFIEYIFTNAPLSAVNIIILQNQDAICISKFQYNSSLAISKLQLFFSRKESGGVISLQAGIEKANELFKHVISQNCDKSIIFFCASTLTVDSVPLLSLATNLVEQNISLSIVSVAPVVQAFLDLSHKTNGLFSVVDSLNEIYDLFPSLLNHFAVSKTHAEVFPIGFPEFYTTLCAHLCLCHSKLVFQAYQCPNCLGPICELPFKCTCGLYLCTNKTLVSTKFNQETNHTIAFQPPATSREEAPCCSLCERKVLSGGSALYPCNTLLCIACADLIIRNSLNCPKCAF